MNNKVLVAMSGGVDSSVAVVLLKQQDYEISGATLKLYDKSGMGIRGGDDDIEAKTCCSLNDVEDARSVAYRLGIEHYVFNFSQAFKNEVINRFIDSYNNAETPNPCIDCNRYIKFSKMLEQAITLGYDFIATGHYARIEYDNASKRYLLKKAADISKDQTYVLYSMTQKELSKTLFPLGGLMKSQVRKIAEANNLVNANKPDSQDICFVGDGDYAAFIEETLKMPSQKGYFVNSEGGILGEHKGIIHYTIGQRKGLGLSLGHPAYVIDKDPKDNTVKLGSEEELLSNRLLAGDINLIAFDKLMGPMKATVKARYSQKEAKAVLFPIGDNKIIVEFKHMQRALTPGQAVVFYQDDIVIGGGTIKRQ